MNFIKQLDKISRAYYSNQLDPWSSCGCFVGNLLNNKDAWANGRDVFRAVPLSGNIDFAETCVKKESNGFYTFQEILDLEHNFLIKVYPPNDKYDHPFNKLNITEDTLYDGIVSTLNMLKKLHESKGEKVGGFRLEKRVLSSERS